MSFIDEVYSLYKDHLTGDEEDAVSIVLSILEDQSRENVMKIINEMNDQEVIQMLGVYLVEMIKMKMAQEGKNESLKSKPLPLRVH